MAITAIKGFNDILPAESGRWQHIEQAARRVFELNGFSEIRVPIMEKTDLFCRSIGDATAVLGGIGNLRGALLGGLLLGVMELYGQALFGTEWRDVVAFVLLILVLMFRPTGILGESLGRARA